MLLAPSTTWLLVTIWPSALMMTPLPVPDTCSRPAYLPMADTWVISIYTTVSMHFWATATAGFSYLSMLMVVWLGFSGWGEAEGPAVSPYPLKKIDRIKQARSTPTKAEQMAVVNRGQNWLLRGWGALFGSIWGYTSY